MIKVLWLEDEIDKIEAFIDLLDLKGIKATIKDTANNFTAELNANLDQYDAAILDAMGVINSLEEKTSSKALEIAKNTLLRLQHKKNIPYFILSAQLTKDENLKLIEHLGEELIYIKTKDEERLIEDIKRAVSAQPEYILRNKYADILTVFNDNQLGSKHYERVFNLIKWVESSQEIDNTEDQLTSIRKIVESIFHALAKQGLVPSEIMKSKGWINGTSKFLSGLHDDFEQNEKYVHPTISESIFRILNIIQDGAHAEGGLRLRVDEYMQTNKTDYLFKSCVYLLLEIISWYKNLSEAYQDIEFNKSLWKIKETSKDVIIGKITKIAENNYGTFLPNNDTTTITIPPHFIKQYEIVEGQTLKVKTRKEDSKTFIKEIIII